MCFFKDIFYLHPLFLSTPIAFLYFSYPLCLFFIIKVHHLELLFLFRKCVLTWLSNKKYECRPFFKISWCYYISANFILFFKIYKFSWCYFITWHFFFHVQSFNMGYLLKKHKKWINEVCCQFFSLTFKKSIFYVVQFNFQFSFNMHVYFLQSLYPSFTVQY